MIWLMLYQIVEASYLPMSIVIIGVGSANFGTMDFLDADNTLLKDKYGKKANADIVQAHPAIPSFLCCCD